MTVILVFADKYICATHHKILGDFIFQANETKVDKDEAQQSYLKNTKKKRQKDKKTLAKSKAKSKQSKAKHLPKQSTLDVVIPRFPNMPRFANLSLAHFPSFYFDCWC